MPRFFRLIGGGGALRALRSKSYANRARFSAKVFFVFFANSLYFLRSKAQSVPMKTNFQANIGTVSGKMYSVQVEIETDSPCPVALRDFDTFTVIDLETDAEIEFDFIPQAQIRELVKLAIEAIEDGEDNSSPRERRENIAFELADRANDEKNCDF